MTTLEIPENGVLSARERRVRPAPGIAQRGSTLTGASVSVQRMCFPSSDGELVIEIGGVPPAWFEPTVEKLGRLLTMPPDWDSYKARRVEPACVVSAIETVLAVMQDNTPPPAVVSTSCGGVQLEWHTRGIDLEVDVCSPTRILASYEDQETGESWEERVFDFSRIRRALREMAWRQVRVPEPIKEDSSGGEGPTNATTVMETRKAPEPIPPDLFWQDKSLAQLAVEQDVAAIGRFEEVWGAGSHLWPTEEEFEAFLAASRGDVASGN